MSEEFADVMITENGKRENVIKLIEREGGGNREGKKEEGKREGEYFYLEGNAFFLICVW